jgi:predicted RNA-binding Zn ribbon-like protein
VSIGRPAAESRTPAPAAGSRPRPVTASLAIVLPDEPLPVRLMNTIWADRLGVHDALTTTADLLAWLDAVRPDGGEPVLDPRDLERFRVLRDALRRLAAVLTGDTRPAAASATRDVDEAVADVNVAAAQAPPRPRLAHRAGELRLAAAGHATWTRRLLSAIAYESIDLLTGDDRAGLRACHAPGCVLYFVRDHPRREWCSTACGNRARAARHYQRHRGNPPDRSAQG